MNIEILVDAKSVVKIDIDLPVIVRALQKALLSDANARSTPATESQMRDLLSRIDSRSRTFLQEIAASEDGAISWKRMRSIFGIEKPEDWSAYSGSFGKGITRAYRNILNDRVAKLVWWIDADWDDADWDDDMCSVFVDGSALVALRLAVGTSPLIKG